MADAKSLKTRRTIMVVLAAAVVGFGIVALIMRTTGPGGAPTPQGEGVAATDATPAAAASPTPARAATPRPTATADEAVPGSVFSQIFEDADPPSRQAGTGDWMTTFAGVTVRLTLAALLSALLAFRPRRFALFFKRNPFVAQTQILLAVVASALMMIVGDSAARAFGIFAAVSLVRFRTNIKDPKEITVLLVSLAIGLATGVGRWELAVILAFFVLLLLWGLEYREPELVFRAMELKVTTRNVEATQDVLLRLFRRYNFDAEMRTIDRPDADDAVGSIIYYVNVSPLVSTDRLSEEILSSDHENVDSVEWDQQKNASLYYQ